VKKGKINASLKLKEFYNRAVKELNGLSKRALAPFLLLFVRPLRACPALPQEFEAQLVPVLLALIFIIAAGIFSALSQANHRRLRTVSLSFGLAWSLSLAWLFRKVPFALGGGNWDSWYSHAMATTFKYFWKNMDFNYAGLSCFYPFYYHYFAGKLAWLLSAAPHAVLKYLPVIIAAFLPLFLYSAWRAVVRPHTALLITALALFYSFRLYLYKPYEFLSLAFLLPWWFFYFEGDGSPRSWKRILAGGLAGGILLGTYYLWFFPVFLLLALEFSYAALGRRNFREWWANFRGKLGVLFFTAVFSAFFWLPYLLDLLTRGGESLQNRWFTAADLTPYFPLYSSFSLREVLAFAGLVFVIYAFRKNPLARASGKLLLGLYALILLSDLLALAGSPMPNFRFNQMLEMVYLVAFAFAWEEVGTLKTSFRERTVLIFSLVLFSLLLLRLPGIKDSRLFKLASSPVLNLEKRKDLKALYGKSVLNLPPRALVFIPAKKFVAQNPFYSHPSAHLGERLAFLYLLQFSRNPSFFFFALRKNRFSPVEYIYTKNGRLRITAFYENYPHRKVLLKYLFQYDFLSRRVLKPRFRNVIRRGDFVAWVPDLPPDFSSLTPVEKFVAAKFLSRKIPLPRPVFSNPWVKVYRLKEYLLFYREDCPRERWRGLEFLVKTGGFRRRVSLKEGLLTTTCALVVPCPEAGELEVLPMNP